MLSVVRYITKMESEGNATKNSEHGASAGLDYILKQLDLMSEFMDRLEVKTQLLQCNLTVCFTHPEKMACLQTDVETPTWLSGAQMMED
ncbi:synaptonemal complex central element protein 3 isoform X2 [Pimephales promelas]|uniref:synaptonemal complex central element protein 3 isoform X2 n=1 Tax=Pimephales promelas TaxID=90988 RepID=UPI001955F4C7|nr:synaptonemal complex central element protein 3 isoform X2 [Pimephales promelas]KAG1954410.1 hypothetical protein F2P79_008735 [Pimephales promelas]